MCFPVQDNFGNKHTLYHLTTAVHPKSRYSNRLWEKKCSYRAKVALMVLGYNYRKHRGNKWLFAGALLFLKDKPLKITRIFMRSPMSSHPVKKHR